MRARDTRASVTQSVETGSQRTECGEETPVGNELPCRCPYDCVDAQSSRDNRDWTDFRELLELSLPTFARYAKLHGYDVVIGTGDEAGDRPPSWGKIPMLQRLLRLRLRGLDGLRRADTRRQRRPRDDHPGRCLSRVRGCDARAEKGDCPLMGVWALRSESRAQRFLAEIWKQEDLVSHRLWEQSAAMRLIGWTTELPFVKTRQSEWDEGSFVLSEESNMVPLHPIGYAPGNVRHYAAWTSAAESSTWAPTWQRCAEITCATGSD